MVFKLVIKTLAEQDIAEAVEWYYKQSPHLIPELIAEIDNALELLRYNPQHFQKRYKEVRVIFIKTFPFSLYYTIENKTIFVHAFMHNKRDPKTGTRRIL